MLLQPSIKEYSTAFGEINRFQLPDGSYVTLNGNSSLKFQNAGLLEKSRKSWLEGEGFFEIQSTSDKQPFLVHLGEIDVLVTGTRFNAHKRPGKTSVFPGGGQCGFNTDSHR